MPKLIRTLLLIQLTFLMHFSPAHAEAPAICKTLLRKSPIEWLKEKAINTTLDLMAVFKGLPKYVKRTEELKQTGKYLNYANFGEMGLAELGISVRYNQANAAALNTNRPLIIVANHHLGIADGLALQYLASRERTEKPSLLFLARWIQKILPEAVYGDEHHWGTAIPVEINLPKQSDPLFDRKMKEVKEFNSSWNRTSLRVLKDNGAFIIFPAGHVASIEDEGGDYPDNVYDAENSWQDGVLNFVRMGKADIVFAHIDSVNSEAFYRDRKRLGGGDKERVIWFFSEAIAKKGKTIDVNLSKPMSLDEMYLSLAQSFGSSVEALKADPKLAAELMRKFTYKVSENFKQELDTTDSPKAVK